MSDPDPEEFRQFHELLTQHAPDGYTPWYFRVREGSKAPATSYGSWKDEEARLTVEEAVSWMERGGNVGVAGTDSGPLVNVDIDDEDETTPADLKQTLMARSRSRTGIHAWYFEPDDTEIPNIPTDESGEVRANWQYVVAPGSYVKTDRDLVPEAERDRAGYYTVAESEPVAAIDFDELPEVFREHHRREEQADTDAELEYEMPDADEDGSSRQSALFDVDARDVVRKEGGSTDTDDRWSAIFHGSETDANMSVSSKGLIQCWRHNVTHNGLQALTVLSEYRGHCADVGAPHKGSNAGPSCIEHEDGAHIWHAWKYAKQNGYIPDDDPVPYTAIRHLCRVRDLCPVSEIPDEGSDGSLPAKVYDAALTMIENQDGLDPGRKTTDKIDPTPRSDGGVSATTEPTDNSGPRSLEERIEAAIHDQRADAIDGKTARDYIATAFVQEHDFVYPEEGVTGWRETLYVYAPDEGVYEPRGEHFLKKNLERMAGGYATNHVTNEIIEKVKRLSIERGEAFKTPPERLVVGNGILDLHVGELDPFTPDEYHRTKIDVDWNPDAGDPTEIDGFFHEIVSDSDVPTLYRLIAHTLMKEYVAGKAAILIGSGENGKSMFMKLVERFIGGHNVAHRELQDFSDDLFALNNLQGKLANLATEIGEQELKDTTAFKKATGRDPIQAPVKHESPVKFQNYATMMFATNEMPVFGQDNHAIWRRWLYLEFPYTFNEDKDDCKDPVPERVLKQRLFKSEELEALLLKCQAEIQRWYAGEPFFADAMEPDEVREKMKRAAEPVYAFASACLEAGDPDEAFEPKSVVRSAYQAYADEEDLPRIPYNEFGARLLALRDFRIDAGQRRVDGSHMTVYNGVELSDRGRQVLGIDEPDENDDQETMSDSFEQAKPVVLDRVRKMVEDNDSEPVPANAVAWSLSNEMSVGKAEQAIKQLIQDGGLIDTGDGVIDC